MKLRFYISIYCIINQFITIIIIINTHFLSNFEENNIKPSLKDWRTMMHTREGLIPTILGTAVTTSGFAMKKILPTPLAWGLVGFGLAHIVLGSIDLVEHRNSLENELY